MEETIFKTLLSVVKDAAKVIKEGGEVVTPLLAPAQKVWQWLRDTFKKDELATKLLNEAAGNPESEAALSSLTYPLQQRAQNDAEFLQSAQAVLQEWQSARAQHPVEIKYNKQKLDNDAIGLQDVRSDGDININSSGKGGRS